MTDRLTVQRLFSDPPLVSASPGQLRFSPDGRYVAFTLLSEDDRERQDLWLADCATGSVRCIVDARQLEAGNLSSADRERLERKRQFVGGVTDYAWYPTGDAVMLPLSGSAYRYDLTSGEIDRLPLPEGTNGEVRLSTTGRYLSSVIAGDLYVTDLETTEVVRVTDDASDVITNGAADFIAQEEMHRFEGYWWSPTDDRLVFTRVDTSPIPMTPRQEIHADGAISVEQRYPYAGGPNATVELRCFHPQTGEIQGLNPPVPDDGYLARVQFAAGTLTVQTQDRAQQHLTLCAQTPDGTWTTWFEEHSDTWVNLHDNLRATPSGTILLTSEQNGEAQLFAGFPGKLEALTPEGMHIESLLAADNDTAWVSGWDETPIEQHLYAVTLKDGAVRRITQEPGCHTCLVHAASGRFVSAHSNIRTTPKLVLGNLSSGDTERVLHDADVAEGHAYLPYMANHQTPTFGTLLAEDGQTLHYRLTPPLDASSDAKSPVIVYVYGGPGPQKVRNEWAPLLLQLFAHAGFGVFELDNRGTGFRGRTFEAPLYKRMGGPEVADQVAGLGVLADYDWVDPERVGVFGHSYGGFMTLMCLAKAPNAFRAGVSVAPVSDWRLYDTHYTERFMGDPKADADAYDASAVIPWLDNIASPLLLIHGMADDNVLFTHSTLLMRELQRLNKKFELMTYPGSKHALQERDVSIHRYELIVDFFKRNL